MLSLVRTISRVLVCNPARTFVARSCMFSRYCVTVYERMQILEKEAPVESRAQRVVESSTLHVFAQTILFRAILYSSTRISHSYAVGKVEALDETSVDDAGPGSCRMLCRCVLREHRLTRRPPLHRRMPAPVRTDCLVRLRLFGI